MTRRLLAALTLATVVAGGLGAFATPASATDDDNGWICIGGENQRKPGYYQYLCLENVTDAAGVGALIGIGH